MTGLPIADPSAAVLVVRVWREQADPPLRARLLYTLSADSPPVTFAVAAGTGDICTAVERWLLGWSEGRLDRGLDLPVLPP